MTRDEAIEKAGELIMGRLKSGYGSSVKINKTETVVLVYDSTDELYKSFVWEEPRRIPPKGTPVSSAVSSFVGYSHGTTDDQGRLECYACTDHKLNDWIELEEVKP